MTRVLIVGEGKSGTTALLRSVSSALGEPSEIFEPMAMSAEDLEPDPLVVKKLLLNWKQAETRLLDSFDKRILIVRDPRDRLISHLLYDAYNRAQVVDEAGRQEWLGLLGQKSATPDEVPFVRLVNTWWRLAGSDLLSHYVRANDRVNSYKRRMKKHFFVLAYEDYVDGRFEALNEYLDLNIEPGVVGHEEARVARSGRYGEWRNWFTPEDVEVFRPMTDQWLHRHGYDHEDWELSSPGEIPTDTTVDYVAGLFDRRGLAS